MANGKEYNNDSDKPNRQAQRKYQPAGSAGGGGSGQGSEPGGPDNQEHHEYRNKAVINQRGATVEINNSTDREELKLSQYSGSNIALNNLVNSELATNNKQTKVINDEFKSVCKDKNVFVGKDKVERVVENTYHLRGFQDDEQIQACEEWKEAYGGTAVNNSHFRTQRGGSSFPQFDPGNQHFPREADPAVAAPFAVAQPARGRFPNLAGTGAQSKLIVENTFPGYGIKAQDEKNNICCPKVNKEENQVKDFTPVRGTVANANKFKGKENKIKVAGRSAIVISPTVTPQGDVDGGSGSINNKGSQAPGVIKYGPEWLASTEGGMWKSDPVFANGAQIEAIEALQNTLNDYEADMGNGGDEITFVKRHKIETIGAATNNYPSVRIDDEGRTSPLGIDVGARTSYENLGAVPHVEQIDNDMNFPVGNYTLNVGNRYNILVGSGGVQLKTTGAIEIAGTTTNIAGNQVIVQSSSGVHIASESVVEIQSKNSIALRSDRQVLVQPSLGVKLNLKVGGGSYTEGEVFLHHITAPAEVQETHCTELYGKFNADCSRELQIGEAGLDVFKLNEQIKAIDNDPFAAEGQKICWYPVYALSGDDLIKTYPHSHHFNNIPLRLTEKNADVRKMAMCENINRDDVMTPAQRIVHERKDPWTSAGVFAQRIGGKGSPQPCVALQKPPVVCTTPPPPDCPEEEDCGKPPDPGNGGSVKLPTTEKDANIAEAKQRENEQQQINDAANNNLPQQEQDDLREKIWEAQKDRACGRACAGIALNAAQIADFGPGSPADIVGAIQARDAVDGLGNDVGDGGVALQAVCGCGGPGNGGNGGNDDGINPHNNVLLPPPTPGNGPHVDQLLGFLAGGEFGDMGEPGPCMGCPAGTPGAPGLENPVMADAGELAFEAPEWRDAMDGLREFWDGINVQRQEDGEPLILFPAVPDPRHVFFPGTPGKPGACEGGNCPGIPAGVWGPNSPNNPANAPGAAPRRVA